VGRERGRDSDSGTIKDLIRDASQTAV